MLDQCRRHDEATPPRIRPPRNADERTQLLGSLDMQRAIIAWKCEGLSESDAHRSLLLISPLMTLAGIVSHMRWVEHLWFEIVLLGCPAEGPRFDDDAGMRVEGIPLAQLLKDYAQQCQVSNEIIAAHTWMTPAATRTSTPRAAHAPLAKESTGPPGALESRAPSRTTPVACRPRGAVRRRICGCHECGSPGWGRPQYRCRPPG
ncbi:mycothiol transferase [Streptomyces malaysiensis]|uniref:mycothiol transferase n=1 Tax=Streptomyces malaysiensis TaxID=92644 RepID=UPI003D9F4576